MKKTIQLTLLLITLLSFSSYKAHAADFASVNDDGVTICFNYINNKREAEVTYYGDGRNDLYSGNVVIPEEVWGPNYDKVKVTRIGKLAFANNYGLTTLTIPNSVTTISERAFENCSYLSSITIGSSVNSIGYDAFKGCSSLSSVYISDINAWCNIIFDSHPESYHLFLNGEEVKDVNIPDGITSVYGIFTSCKSITSVTIPSSVTEIAHSAFMDCINLTSITIPNSVKEIGGKAFANCTSLSSVHITDLTTWCEILFSNFESNPLFYAHHLFLNGQEVKDLVIPNSVTIIGDGVFYYCTSLASVTIPNSATIIGERSFQACTGLTSVTIGSSVTTIRDRSFQGCTGLTSVTIGNSLTSIGYEAFADCSSLTSITIPNSVTSIGGNVFQYCSSMSSVTSLIDNPFEIEGKYSDFRTFSLDVFNNSILYVPKGTIDKYRTTEGWRDFVNIIEMDGTDGIENYNCEKILDNPYFNLNDQHIEGQPLQKGVYIKNGKKVLMK